MKNDSQLPQGETFVSKAYKDRAVETRTEQDVWDELREVVEMFGIEPTEEALHALIVLMPAFVDPDRVLAARTKATCKIALDGTEKVDFYNLAFRTFGFSRINPYEIAKENGLITETAANIAFLGLLEYLYTTYDPDACVGTDIELTKHADVLKFWVFHSKTIPIDDIPEIFSSVSMPGLDQNFIEIMKKYHHNQVVAIAFDLNPVRVNFYSIKPTLTLNSPKKIQNFLEDLGLGKKELEDKLPKEWLEVASDNVGLYPTLYPENPDLITINFGQPADISIFPRLPEELQQENIRKGLPGSEEAEQAGYDHAITNPTITFNRVTGELISYGFKTEFSKQDNKAALSDGIKATLAAMNPKEKAETAAAFAILKTREYKRKHFGKGALEA